MNMGDYHFTKLQLVEMTDNELVSNFMKASFMFGKTLEESDRIALNNLESELMRRLERGKP